MNKYTTGHRPAKKKRQSITAEQLFLGIIFGLALITAYSQIMRLI